MSIMKISIREVICLRSWFEHYGCSWNIFAFSFELLSFEKKKDILVNGILWTLDIEVVNLLKGLVSDSHIAHKIVIVDQDDYSLVFYAKHV